MIELGENLLRGEELAALVREEVMRPVPSEVAAMARSIAEAHRDAARAVLFYGSCLRESDLDGRMLDFYLIVSDYRSAYRSRWLAFANRLIPPNVFSFRQGLLVAKYAVLSESDFARRCGPGAGDVSVWARFAQPARLVWTSDDRAEECAIVALASAAPTLIDLATPMLSADASNPLDIWRTGFALTYSCELRAEGPERPAALVGTDPDRYRRFAAAIAGEQRIGLDADQARRKWRRLRRRGRALSVLRLVKGLTTFSGGPEYIVWKISRHARSPVELKPWQKRWPLLGAIVLLPRLIKQGVIH